jgi:xylan 1,4-beta-xylosidase
MVETIPMGRREFLKRSALGLAGLAAAPSILTGEPTATAPSGADVSARAAGRKFAPFWRRCVGAGRANEGLRASWLEHLRLCREECGFEYVRFHGLFHDDMFVYREVRGQPVYNWQYIDDLFDRLLALGARPFVELSFCPADLASDDNSTFWWKAHTSPPKDYGRWAELVGAFVRHGVERYGLEEVRRWYFEVWNEPDLHGFWSGTKSQYFELYKVSARAIKAVDDQLRVGGPATSNFVPDDRFAGEREDKTKQMTNKVADLDALSWRGVWIEDFLAYGQREGLPVDFVSTHPYPTDFALNPETGRNQGRVRGVDATRQDMAWLKEAVARSAYPHAEIHLTEWNSSPSSRDAMHDALPEAAYLLKVNTESIGLADSLAFWTFTDVFEEAGAGDTVFHGGFGLVNYQGIVKPAFHAYRMLHELGDEIIHQQKGLVVTRHAASGKITALGYHYPAELKSALPFGSKSVVEQTLRTGAPRRYGLQVTDLPAQASFVVETLDRDHGCALEAWSRMGRPEPPSREQTAELKQQALATRRETIHADDRGRLEFRRTLEPWAVILLQQQ